MKRTIIFLALAIFAVTMHAQRSSFFDKYMQLRELQENESITIEKISGEDVIASIPKKLAEEERILLETIKEVIVVLDMGETSTSRIDSQINDLLITYDKLLSKHSEGLDISLRGIVKNDKIDELIAFVNGGNSINYFLNILFATPVRLQDFMSSFQFDIHQLVNLNPQEDDHTFIGIGIDETLLQMMTSSFFSGFPGFCNIPITIEVVQVDGKYSIRATGATFFDRNRLYTTKPRIYGSNPGNTYVVTVSENNVAVLHDRYGQIIAMAFDFTPVYVLGSEEEVAAFIFREGNFGYSLFETPEIYTAIITNTGNSTSIAPRREFRISKEAQSITPTEDGHLRVVMEDGAMEYIPIRRQATNQ